MNDDVITPEEFEERLLTLRETTRSNSECEYYMHKLVIDLLSDLGYGDGAEIYAETVID